MIFSPVQFSGMALQEVDETGPMDNTERENLENLVLYRAAQGPARASCNYGRATIAMLIPVAITGLLTCM